jgi:hypothetical protein
VEQLVDKQEAQPVLEEEVEPLLLDAPLLVLNVEKSFLVFLLPHSGQVIAFSS